MKGPPELERWKRFAAALAFLAAFASSPASAFGAGPFDRLDPGAHIFRINGETVEKRVFQRFVEIAFPEEKEPDADRLPALADSFINHRLLAVRARADGIDRLPRVRSRLETRLNRLWAGVAWTEIVKPNLEPGDGDLSEMAPGMEDAVHLQQLTVETRERAGELRTLALAGGDFTEIIKAHSVGLAAQDGGFVGPVTRKSSRYGPGLMDEIFGLRPGEYSAVVETGTRYAVIRMVEKKPAALLRREWLARNRDRLAAIRARKAWDEWKGKLTRSHEWAVDSRVIDSYLEARHDKAPLDALLEKTAVTVDGVPFTLRDLIDPSGMGVGHGEDAVRSIILRRVEEFAIAREAERLGLKERHPDIALSDALMRERLLAREFLELRGRGLTVTEAELREYYEENRSKFVSPRAYDFSLITTRSSARLKTIYGMLAKGSSFDEVADRWSDGRESAGIPSGFVEEAHVPAALASLTGLSAGEYSPDPVRMEPAGGGAPLWAVPMMNAVREARALPFEETDRASMAKSVIARKRERMIRETVESLRRENRIEYSREFMEAAALPPAPAYAGGDGR